MRLAAAVLLVLSLVACSRSDRSEHDDAASSSPSPDPQLTTGVAAGDIRIVESGGAFDLALIGDTISAGIAPSPLATARSVTDTEEVPEGGLVSSVERMVKGTVQGALAKRVAFPLSAIRDARYQSGRIVFDWTGQPVQLLEHTMVNGKPLLERFRGADARRFVEAVRARKR